MEHKESCGFCDLLLLLAVFSLMLPLSHSSLPILLSCALFTSLKDTAWDANMIYVFYKIFCIFCTSKETIRLLFSVADWDTAGAAHGKETLPHLQRCEQHSLLTQTLFGFDRFWPEHCHIRECHTSCELCSKTPYCSHWVRQFWSSELG